MLCCRPSAIVLRCVRSLLVCGVYWRCSVTHMHQCMVPITTGFQRVELVQLFCWPLSQRVQYRLSRQVMCITHGQGGFVHHAVCLVCRIDPIAYIQIALAVNEFNAPRWLNLPVDDSNASAVILSARGVPQKGTLLCLLICNSWHASTSLAGPHLPLVLASQQQERQPVLHLADL